jgi:hypothetical protein
LGIGASASNGGRESSRREMSSKYSNATSGGVIGVHSTIECVAKNVVSPSDRVT